MPAHFSTELELRQLLARTQMPLDEIPRGAGRNQSSAHTQLVKSCHEWLMLKGIFCWRQNTGCVQIGKRLVRFGTPGLPDIIGAIWKTATMFGIECKTGNGKQTAEQREMELRFRSAHARYIVIRSIDDLEKWFA